MNKHSDAETPIGPENEIGGSNDPGSIGEGARDSNERAASNEQGERTPDSKPLEASAPARPSKAGDAGDSGIPVARLGREEVFEIEPAETTPARREPRPIPRAREAKPADGEDVDARGDAHDADEPADADRAIVAESWLTPANAAMAGGALTLASVLASVIASASVWYISGPLMLYRVIAHSVAGFLALAAVANVFHRPVGSMLDAAARVWAMIALAVFVTQVPIGLIPGAIDSFVIAAALSAIAGKFLLRADWKLIGCFVAAQLALTGLLELGLVLAHEEGFHAVTAAGEVPEQGAQGTP